MTPALFDCIIRSVPATAQPSRSGAQSGEDASTRERMLDVALQTFAELGYDGASTRAIATRAGVNQGLIPYYFGSKEQLWREAVDRAFAQLVEGAPGLLEGDDLGPDEARAQTAELIRLFVRFSARRPEFTRMMCEEGKREGPRMHWIVDRHVRPFFETVAARIRGQSGLGGAPAVDPVLYFYILVGAVTHLFHQAPECRRLTGRDPADEAMVEAHADALVALFVGPIQGDPS